MTRAFIVNLDTGSDTDFNTIAEEINEDLISAGHNVLSVAPWQSPNDPTTQTQTLNPPPLTPPSLPNL